MNMPKLLGVTQRAIWGGGIKIALLWYDSMELSL
jgi:hypothetical protein